MSGSASERVTEAWFSGARWLWLLWPLSIVYALVIWIRRRLYFSGIKSIEESSVPVVVVGNIVAGGAGKSPLVAYLVRHLQELGYAPGVVSRGYGADVRADEVVEVRENSRAKDVGDEPLMLKRQLACPVVVAPRRAQGVQKLAELGCNLVVADDGLQHYAMARDIEICVVDAKRRWGNGRLLPSGPLREPLSRLSEADYIVLNGHADSFQNPVNAPEPVSMTLAPQPLKSLSSDATQTLESMRARQVVAVAGIGNPERFFGLLELKGLDIERLVFEDHHIYQPSDFANIKNKTIIMTEKDAVKCYSYDLEDAWYLPVEARLSDNLAERIVERLIARGKLTRKI